MDLQVETNPSELAIVFSSLGFEVQKKDSYYSATLNNRQGRYHATFCQLGAKIYCDFHFDHRIHLLFWGVDYTKRPEAFCEERLRPSLEKRNISFSVNRVNWFTKKNKAVFRGFRL